MSNAERVGDPLWKRLKLHARCEQNWAEQCNRKQMTRSGVILHYPEVVCDPCLEKIAVHYDGMNWAGGNPARRAR